MKADWVVGSIESFEGITVSCGRRPGWFEVLQGAKTIQLPMSQLEELILILQELERNK